MKQNIFLALTWISVLIMIIFCIFSKPVNMYESRKDVSIVQVDEFLYMEQDCSSTEVETIQMLMGYLPKSFLDDFKAMNGRVILVSNLKDDCVGYTEITDNSITVYIEDDYAFDALIHEFGHVYLHFHPMDDSFKEIYKTEAKSLVNAYYGDCPYFYSDETEYFAQAFQTVLCMRGYDTQEAAPKTFSYMNAIFKKLFSEK